MVAVDGASSLLHVTVKHTSNKGPSLRGLNPWHVVIVA